MKKVKCGECKHWDRKNVKRIASHEGVIRDDIAVCLVAHTEPCFEYRDREIKCCDFEQVEPEVYEVECVWEYNSVILGLLPGICGNGLGDVFGKKDKFNLIGKRTKLTIEVLD